jgi:hypothetical protein
MTFDIWGRVPSQPSVSDEGCLLLLDQGGEGDAGGICAVVKAAVACGNLLFHRHQELQQQQVRPVEIAASPTAPDHHEHAVRRDVSRLLSDLLDRVCSEPRVAAHFTAREMVVGAGGLLDNAFAKAEPALVAARDVLHAIVADSEARGLVSEADKQAKAAEATKLSRMNFASPLPPSSRCSHQSRRPSLRPLAHGSAPPPCLLLPPLPLSPLPVKRFFCSFEQWLICAVVAVAAAPRARL